MRLELIAAAVLIVGGCGAGQKKSHLSPSPEPSPPLGGSGDAVATVGPAGPNGTNGKDGTNGSNGKDGTAGPIGGLVLYDANGNQIGVQYSDDVGSVAHVMMFDHIQAYLDEDSGLLAAPNNFACMFESSDCTGTCYVYGERWLGVLTYDSSGQTWVAPRLNATAVGAQTMHSYAAAANSCQVNTVTTTASYQAIPYSPSIKFPLAAPLHWDLAPR